MTNANSKPSVTPRFDPTERARQDIDDWNHIADHWDDMVADGGDFQKDLIYPATDQLLSPDPGKRILDCCCGNGNYARRLKQQQCKVVAFDGSSRMIELAKRRGRKWPIEYFIADATNAQELRRELAPHVTERLFDAAVCSMAMMDLPVLQPLLTTVRQVLRPGGAFVFSVGHPAFHTNEAQMLALQDHGQGVATQSFGVIVRRYLKDWPHPSRGLLNQPRPNMIYHRSLSTLLAECFEAGFVVDGMLEPSFGPDARQRSPFTWSRRPDIPPVLVVRLRSAG